MKLYWRIIALILIFGIIVWIGVHTINFTELERSLKSFPLPLALAIIGLVLIISLLKGYRFYIALRINDIRNISLWHTIRAFTASQATSLMIGGEALRGKLIRLESQADYSHIIGTIITHGLMEFAMAIIIIIVGGIFVDEKFMAITISGSTTIIILLAFVSSLKIQKYFLDYLGKFKRLARHRKPLEAFLAKVRGGFFLPNRLYPGPQHWYTFMLAILTHLISGLILYLVLIETGATISIATAIVVAAAGFALQVLGGAIPAGVGITEGGMTGILVAIGIDPVVGITAVLLFRAATVLIPILLGMLTFSIYYGKRLLTPAAPTYDHV